MSCRRPRDIYSLICRRWTRCSGFTAGSTLLTALNLTRGAEKGFETENPGASPHKIDVICHSALLGIELRSSASAISYADIDPEADRARAGRARIKHLGLGAKQFLARVLFSDSHALGALGRNAQGDKKVTRVKMDKP